MRRLLAVTALVDRAHSARPAAPPTGPAPGRPTGGSGGRLAAAPGPTPAMPASGGAAGGDANAGLRRRAARPAPTARPDVRGRSWVRCSRRWAPGTAARPRLPVGGPRRRLAGLADRSCGSSRSGPTDPQLKTLLTDLGTEVAALGADVESIDETELDRLQQRLDQLCAR